MYRTTIDPTHDDTLAALTIKLWANSHNVVKHHHITPEWCAELLQFFEQALAINCPLRTCVWARTLLACGKLTFDPAANVEIGAAWDEVSEYCEEIIIPLGNRGDTDAISTAYYEYEDNIVSHYWPDAKDVRGVFSDRRYAEHLQKTQGTDAALMWRLSRA